MRPFLDFAEEEELLRKVLKYEKQNEVGVRHELSEEYIKRTYKLSKRKEEALNEICSDDAADAAKDNDMRIFCGDLDPFDPMQIQLNRTKQRLHGNAVERV